MIDWSVAERVAGFVAGTPPSSRPAGAGRLAELAEDAERRVLAYTGMQIGAALPRPEALNRQQWIEANLRSMRPLVEPLTDRVGANLGALAAPVRLATGFVMAAQVGALTGYLAGRVLGQYEIALLDDDRAPRLLMVSPNLAEAAEKLGADREELVDWVAFHEVCHAVQFSAVPWLRDHLAGLLRELLGSLEVRLDESRALKLPSIADVRGIVELLRDGDLVSLTIGRERRVLVDRIQAAMALIEGHAEHVMDAVGAEVLPSQVALREAMERRRDGRAGPLRLLDKLLGMELKLRQYRDGKRFVDQVVQAGGMGALNRAWYAPEALPTLTELADPTAWLARTAVLSVTK